MKFKVIDNKTGKEADTWNIALHEEWAQGLVYCDMEGFLISEDGQLMLADECGHVVYCDSERFKVVFEDERPHGEWISCSERLPEEHGYYLVTTDGSHNAVIDIAEYGKFFRKPEYEYVWEWNKASKILAWMPLPEPYKRGGVE